MSEKKSNLIIVDIGLGNLGSILNICKKLDCNPKISAHPEDLLSCDAVILPGVGHFDHGMKKLREGGFEEPLNNAVVELKKPLLGICLGAQMLGKGSEEGKLPGLGWIDMECRKFQLGSEYPVPHMGWNKLKLSDENSDKLFFELGDDSRFYFVHSYFMECESQANILSTTPYGNDFVSVVGEGKVYGVQFHPEKSLRHGLGFLRGFVSSVK